MVIEFFLILLLFVSFAGWGAWAQTIIGCKTDSFPLTILLGLSFFSILTCLLSFFLPLNLYVELVLLAISIIPFFIKKLRILTVEFPKELIKSVWFWIFCIIIVLAGTFYPFRPDYFFYYKPTINWLNHYGLTIGVDNINWSLGQMSVYHIMQAGLDQTIDPFQRLSVFITVLFLIYIFERKAWLQLFAIPFYFLFIQAPSPDVAIVFLSLIVVNELCFNHRVDDYKALMIISVFVFTIKPVAFWLPLWTFIAIIYQNKKPLKDFRFYLFPLLLVILFLIKNVLASSTLFFPLPFTKLNTYWLTDFRILEISNKAAASYTFNRQFTGDEINAMSIFQKIYYWLSISKLQILIKGVITITIILFGVFSLVKKNFIYQLLWMIIVIKTILVFSFSGQFRFMLDSIYPLLFIMFYPVRIGKTKLFVAALSLFLLLLTLISYPPLLKRSIPKFKLIPWMSGFTPKSLLIPEQYTLKRYTKGKIGNLDFYISYFSYDYDTPPPAFSYRNLKLYKDLEIFPQMKDSTNIRKGYYMKKLEREEKEQLGRIVDSCFIKQNNKNSR